MKRIRLTMSQALVKFLDNQYIECDGVETKFVSGMFGIFGHGCVVGVGQALEQGGHNLKFYQGKNEQNMALAAVAYAKQMDRKAIIPCVSSIGPGATNMVTACGCATANRIPLLVLPGDTFACRQPDPVLQQAEFFDNYGRTVTDAFKGVCHYFDRIIRPEQLMTACLNAMRVLTDPADTGAVCLAMPQDVEGEAYDYPEHFLQKRVWHLDRRPISSSQLERATKLIIEAKKPIIVCGGGVRYSGAENELLEFAEKYNIPIAETQAGKGIIDWKNPLNVGGIGVTGGKAANVIGRDADLVIGVGTRFSDFTTSSKWLFNENRKVLGINVCPFDAYKMDAEAIVADAKEAVKALISSCEGYKSEYTNEIKEAKDEWDKIPIFAYADLHKKKLGWTELRYPSIFNKDEIDYILYDPEISYTYTGKEVVVSLGQYDSIFVSSDFKHKKAYNAKSHYLPHVRPVSQNLQIDLFKTIHDRGLQPHYHHLMYDKYRKVFYRFALMPDDNIKPFSNNPHQSFSIIILNKDYEIIGETKFPGNTYAHHLCFVGKKGLYISENNENNPQFDENKLVFRCFTLQGRKK